MFIFEICMLLKFIIGNHLSFKDKQEFSLIAEPLKELPTHLHIPHFYDAQERILKSAAFHGHNSHGKTNFFKSYKLLIQLLLNSFTNNNLSTGFVIAPFLLNTSTIDKPTHFEILFLIKNIKYRYGFEISQGVIISEWLFYAEYRIRENYLFIRNKQDFQLSKTWNKESENRIELQSLSFAKEKVLLLSVLLSLDKIPRIDSILSWINQQIFIPTFGENTNNLLKNATLIYSNPNYKNRILYFIEKADLGFKTIFDKIENTHATAIQKFDKGLVNLWYSNEIERFELYTQHTVYDENYIIKSNQLFDLLKDESDGSIKFFILACLFSHSIINSNITWADELDARLHPELFELLIKLFHEPELNSNGAQLFFTTHSTVLLNKKLRRDQVYLVEKNEYGESTLKRLHTKESPVRIDISIEKEYRKGTYGGVSKKVKKSNDLPSLFD